MGNLKKKLFWIPVAVLTAICLLLGGLWQSPVSAEEAAGDVKLIDFRGSSRLWVNSKGVQTGVDEFFSATSLPGASETDAAEAKAYIAGGEDLQNEYSITYGRKIAVKDQVSGEDTQISGCDVKSVGPTGVVWVAQGNLMSNDKANTANSWTRETYPKFVDFESFNIQLYTENPEGIEQILVRFLDEEMQSAVATQNLVSNPDYGYQYVFNNTTLKEGWTYVEMNLDDIPVYDTHYREDYGNHEAGDNFLGSIEGGIKGNRPVPVGDDAGPMRCSYVQVVVQFNKNATAENPSRVVFDEMNLSKQSVAPVLTKTSETAIAATTGQKVSLKNAFTAADNHTPVGELRYTLSVTKDGAAINAQNIDGANIAFTPYKKGTYLATVTCVDADGNEGKLELTVNVTGDDIDVDGPTADSASLSAFLAKSPFADFTEIDMTTIKFTDDYSPAADIALTYAVKHSDGTSFDAANGKFTPDRNGKFTLTIVAKDKVGNETTLTRNITVNNPNATEPEAPQPKEGCGAISLGGMGLGGGLLALAALALVCKKRRNV